jgi:UDP-glucose 4-epimerase
MQTRDFVHIDDTIDALLLGIEKSGTYNVGSGRESSLLEVIDIMHSITKAKPEYKFELPNDKEIRRSKADITKIKKLGWLPKIELEKGIKLTLEAEGWKPLPIS